jgi:hypothetical protein
MRGMVLVTALTNVLIFLSFVKSTVTTKVGDKKPTALYQGVGK